MNPVLVRLAGQQLHSPQFKDPADLVSWMGALQAQDQRSMKWAVAMRTSKPSYSAFKEAFDSGKIIRTHLMRCTWQLVSGEDLGWMVPLCSSKAKGVMKGWMSANGVDIPRKEEEKYTGLLVDILKGKCLLRDEIFAEFRQRGYNDDERVLGYHIRLAEVSGTVCSGTLHPRKSTYSLVSDRVEKQLTLSREESLNLLATKYLRGRGPASLEDFSWWSGLGKNECMKGIRSLGDEVSSIDYEGRKFWFFRGSEQKRMRKGKVLLIPSYDEYLISYKSRDLVLEPHHSHMAHNNSGIFKDIVSLDGEIVGNWRPSSKDLGITVFREGILLPEESLSKEISRYRYALTH